MDKVANAWPVITEALLWLSLSRDFAGLSPTETKDMV